jgi:putative hemolysin
MITELTILLLLVLANGVFALSEAAMISSRKSRLRALADKGDAGARQALAIAQEPTRFLSTVQVGITLIGIFAGVFAGDTIAQPLTEVLRDLPVVGPHAHAVSLAVVVAAVTGLSLVLGELVPKRLALQHPERYARRVAGPMQALSRAAAPVVWLLGASTSAILRMLGVKGPSTPVITEEELHGTLAESLSAGVLDAQEKQLVDRVLGLDKLRVHELMTVRTNIIWLNADESHDTVWHKIVVSSHTHFPVYEGSRDRVAGVVSVKSIYAHLAAGLPVRIRDLMTPALIVPESQDAMQLLNTFRERRTHLALVADEFGGITGLVTLNDLMEAIAGDFDALDQRQRPAATPRPDGSWLVDAMIELENLERRVPALRFADEADRGEYQTLAGYIVRRFGRVPREGETVEALGHVFEVLDMDRHRIDKVLILPSPGDKKRDGPEAVPLHTA